MQSVKFLHDFLKLFRSYSEVIQPIQFKVNHE
jgi:hypothetical protein